jgi:transposase
MPGAPLPDLDTLDAAALRDMVLKQQAQISSRDEELERLQVQISSHDAELERLILVIARLQRLQFGRKSEKIQRQLEQLELQLEDLEARTAEERQQTDKTLPLAAAVRKPARRALPEHLPREVETHIPQHAVVQPAVDS